MLLWALATLSEAGPSGGARNRREGGTSGWQQGGTGSTGGWLQGGTSSSSVLGSAAPHPPSDRADFSSAASGPSSASFSLRGLPPSLLRGLLASAAAKMDMFGPQVHGMTSHFSHLTFWGRTCVAPSTSPPPEAHSHLCDLPSICHPGHLQYTLGSGQAGLPSRRCVARPSHDAHGGAYFKFFRGRCTC